MSATVVKLCGLELMLAVSSLHPQLCSSRKKGSLQAVVGLKATDKYSVDRTLDIPVSYESTPCYSMDFLAHGYACLNALRSMTLNWKWSAMSAESPLTGEK